MEVAVLGDMVSLSRWQFGVTVGFHFLFVTLSLGMVWLLVAMETFAWRSRDKAWDRAARFFGRIFVLTFVFGAATGIVMEFQFGTNWAVFSKFVADAFGPPLAAETMFAFFLESVFIGVYIFGRDTLPKSLHWLSAVLVAVGATFSAFWIIVTNSWMQTPAGHVIENGKVVLRDFTEVLFNASTWPRFFHTVDGVMIGGAFFVAGVSAYLILKRRETDLARNTLKLAIIAGFILSVLELWPFGHWHAIQVALTQPSKFAAIESVEKTTNKAAFVLFGIPVNDPPRLIYDYRVPGALTWLVYGTSTGIIRGMDSFTPQDLPPFATTFASFHIMVYLGTFFIALTALGVLLIVRGKIFVYKWFLWVLVFSVPLPMLAIQLGWITAEVGRQPWIVYNVMRTADAVSVGVSAAKVAASFWFYAAFYVVLAAIYLYVLGKMIKQGPVPAPEKGGQNVY